MLTAAIALLTARRLTRLVVEDKITEDVRAAVLRRYPTTTKIGYLVTCRACVSLWAALVTLLLLSIGNGRVVQAVTRALALSEAVIVTDTLVNPRDTGTNFM